MTIGLEFDHKLKESSDFKCKIYLDEEIDVDEDLETSQSAENLTPQSVVPGRVVVTVSKPTAFLGICLYIHGKATAKLCISDRRRNRFCHVMCNPHGSGVLEPKGVMPLFSTCLKRGMLVRLFDFDEPYTSWILFEGTEPLNSGPHITSRTRLEIGTHTFPFKIDLTNVTDIPSAFKHASSGSVQHIMAVYMNINPHPYNARKVYYSKFHEQEIYLRPKIDCNRTSFDKCSVTGRRDGTAGSFIQGDLIVNRCKLVLGETMKFKLKITNENGGRISDMSLALVQHLKFSVGNLSKSEFNTILSDVFRGVVGTKSSADWRGSLDIPSNLLLSYKTERNCVQIFYFLRFTVNVVGKGELRGELPVTIGNVRTAVANDGVQNSDEGSIEILDHQYLGPEPSEEFNQWVSPIYTGNLLACPVLQTTSGQNSQEVRRHSFSTANNIVRSQDRRGNLPPSYSEISLFRTPSFETLPPPYDEVSESLLD